MHLANLFKSKYNHVPRHNLLFLTIIFRNTICIIDKSGISKRSNNLMFTWIIKIRSLIFQWWFHALYIEQYKCIVVSRQTNLFRDASVTRVRWKVLEGISTVGILLKAFPYIYTSVFFTFVCHNWAISIRFLYSSVNRDNGGGYREERRDRRDKE